MKKFEAIFGIKPDQVQKNCLLLPLVGKELQGAFNAEKFSFGKVYSAAQGAGFTLIRTGMGPGFVGDAVLYLKEETGCENAILFGSCGSVASSNGLSVGSLVAPSICRSNESFSKLLSLSRLSPRFFRPHRGLFEDFMKYSKKKGVREIVAATIPSLKLEETMVDAFTRGGIDVVDMECSAFFAASESAGLKVAALFYVSDIINEQPFYIELDPVSKAVLSSSIRNAVTLLCDFIKENLND